MKLVVTLCAVLLAPLGQITAAEREPNILIIVGDDMGYADVGFHRCRDIQRSLLRYGAKARKAPTFRNRVTPLRIGSVLAGECREV